MLAIEMRVVIDERLLPLDADLLEHVPKLAHPCQAAALLMRILRHVAAQRFLRLVEELVKAAHRRIAGILRRPLLELTVYGEITLIDLVIGAVAAWTNKDAA